MTEILARQRQIVGSVADWAANDLILGAGEIALERQTDGSVKARVGNGALPFSGSPYLLGSQAALTYRGNADPLAPPPAGAVPGNTYTAKPGGVVAAAWGEPAAGDPVAEGDLLILAEGGAWHIVAPANDLSGFVTELELGATGAGQGAQMVGFKSPAAGAPGRNAWSKFQDVFSVRDMGAVGNNVADDHAAIQAAMNYVASLTPPGALYFPRGDYKSSLALTATQPIRLFGDGPRASILNFTGNVNGIDVAMGSIADLFSRDGEGPALGDFVPVNGWHLSIEGLGLVNHAALGSTTAGAGIKLLGTYYAHLKDIAVVNFFNGLHMTQAPLSRIEGLHVDYINGDGIRINGGNNYSCWFSGLALGGQHKAGSCGIRLQDLCDGLRFSDAVVSQCEVAMVLDAATYGMSLTPEFCSFMRVEFDDCQDGPRLNNCRDIVFDNCLFSCRPFGGSGAGQGMSLGSTGTVDGIAVNDGTFLGNGANGLVLGDNVRGFRSRNSKYVNNSGTAPGSAHGVFVGPGASGFQFVGDLFGNHWGGSGTQVFGLYISNGATKFVVAFCDFSAPTGATFTNAATGVEQNIAHNIGFADPP